MGGGGSNFKSVLQFPGWECITDIQESKNVIHSLLPPPFFLGGGEWEVSGG